MPKKPTYYMLIVFLITSFFINCSKDTNAPIVQNSEVEIEHIKTLGGSKNESAQAVTKTTDGGYAILGYTQSKDGDITNKSNESYDYWVIKYDTTNQLQWQKTYGGSGDDRGADLVQTSDGGYAVIGKSKSNDFDVSENAGFDDFWITKLTENGAISWEKTYGFAGSDTPNSIIQTNDNGFLLTGVLDVSASNGQGNRQTTMSQRHAGGDYWVIKLNANGEREWSNYYGGSFTDTAYDAIQTEDDDYIIAGSSDSNDVDISNTNGGYDYWVIKISSTGSLIWEKSFGGSEIDEARAICQTSDGNYLIVGDTRSDDLDVSQTNGAADLWLIKITPEGTLLWEKTMGGTNFDVGRSISKTQDNGFLISGSSRSNDGNLTTNKGQNDAWVLKIDRAGDLEWQKSIGGSETDFFNAVVELNNQTIVAVGDSNSSNEDISENKGFTDLLILKLK
ncbi:hypothetical protein N8008_00400 [Flavobacteriaceae bacterium]|jgi:hypothetical protein|nr:hypothetical protein [Flavobacteriaceae bacterium]MDC1194974.1 hypothetical protein [Flavobacteriaceae bacterium]